MVNTQSNNPNDNDDNDDNDRQRYEESMSRKATLESELAGLAGKLARAEKLVSGLAGERARWQGSIGALEARVRALPGDAVVAAAFLSYAGPFPSEYRDELAQTTWLPQVRLWDRLGALREKERKGRREESLNEWSQANQPPPVHPDHPSSTHPPTNHPPGARPVAPRL